MELSRVVIACQTDAAYADVREAAKTGALQDTFVETQRACPLNAATLIVETAPFTSGVITADTVTVVACNPHLTYTASEFAKAKPTPSVPARAAADPLLRLAPFCRQVPPGVGAAAQGAGAAPTLRVKTSYGPACQTFSPLSRDGSCPTEGVISKETAAALSILDDTVLLLAPAGSEGSRRGVKVQIAASGVEQGCIEVSAEVFHSIFHEGLKFPAVSAETAGEGRVVDTTLVQVVHQDAVETADWVEVRPVAVPYQSVLDVSPALFDEALRVFFTKHPTLMLHLDDVISVPLPRGAEFAAQVITLDDDHFGEPGITPCADCIYLTATKCSKDGRLLDDLPFVVKKDVTEIVLLTQPVPRALPPVLDAAVQGVAAKRTREVYDFLRQIFDIHRRSDGQDVYCGSLLLTAEEGSGGTSVLENRALEGVHQAAKALGCHVLEKSGTLVTKQDVEKLIGIAANTFPTVLILRDVEALFGPAETGGLAGQDEASGGNDAQASAAAFFSSRLKEVFNSVAHPVVLCCACTLGGSVPSSISSLFQKTIMVGSPSAAEREAFFVDNVRDTMNVSKAVLPEGFAKLTAGLSVLGMEQVASSAVKHALTRVTQHLASSKTTLLAGASDAGILLEFSDFAAAVSGYSKAHQISVSTNVQKVSWKDIGGLKEAKEEILECIHLPLTQPQLFSDSGLKPRVGILMYGPPGCGKTLLAKGVATECGLNFISVKGPEMLNMYVGESEKNIRELFAKARKAAPCVVFFDELDALVPNRGAKGDSGGVMDRIVAQLLTEVDSLGDPNEFVFIIGATNRPDLIDQSLLRPGRFDRCVYLGVASSTPEQATILKAQTRKMALHPDVSFHDLASRMPKTFSGADLYALTSEALMLAMREQVDTLVANVELEREKLEAVAAEDADSDAGDDAQGVASSEKPDDALSGIVVTQEHFEASLAATAPSITVGDLARYQAMKDQFNTTSQ
eukprot:Rhum_TRINITY_DN25040_c0_g1::Rhum_TRINITY_DN25040_c0_g1_i1::g.181007::m.181007/K13339/PEX6, PXAAA1; peroxin-6